jgi:hypothetical protein
MQIFGSVMVSDANGSFTLSLSGHSGPMPLVPNTPASVGQTPATSFLLKFTVVDGTGSFKNLHSSGIASLSLMPNRPPVPVDPPLPLAPAHSPHPLPPLSVPPLARVPLRSPDLPHSPIAMSPSPGVPTFLQGEFFLRWSSEPPPVLVPL